MVKEAVLEILPLERPIDAEVTLPGSKSYTNRALIIAAMAGGRIATAAGALQSTIPTTWRLHCARWAFPLSKTKPQQPSEWRAPAAAFPQIRLICS